MIIATLCMLAMRQNHAICMDTTLSSQAVFLGSARPGQLLISDRRLIELTRGYVKVPTYSIYNIATGSLTGPFNEIRGDSDLSVLLNMVAGSRKKSVHYTDINALHAAVALRDSSGNWLIADKGRTRKIHAGALSLCAITNSGQEVATWNPFQPSGISISQMSSNEDSASVMPWSKDYTLLRPVSNFELSDNRTAIFLCPRRLLPNTSADKNVEFVSVAKTGQPSETLALIEYSIKSGVYKTLTYIETPSVSHELNGMLHQNPDSQNQKVYLQGNGDVLLLLGGKLIRVPRDI